MENRGQKGVVQTGLKEGTERVVQTDLKEGAERVVQTEKGRIGTGKQFN